MNILKELEGKKVKQTFFGRECDVDIIRIIREAERQGEYLDGQYTKGELLSMAERMPDSYTYSVYGQLSNYYDVKDVMALQELAKQEFNKKQSGNTKLFIEKDYSNEILLKVFKDGDEPQY